MFNAYLLLFGATVAEIIGTVALKYSDGMTRLVPSLIVVVAYAVAFWLAAVSLRVLPLFIVSAIWAGLCIVSLALIGVLQFDEKLGWGEVAGIAMILGGAVILTIFPRSAGHKKPMNYE